jgi:hypothetical protein
MLMCQMGQASLPRASLANGRFGSTSQTVGE